MRKLLTASVPFALTAALLAAPQSRSAGQIAVPASSMEAGGEIVGVLSDPLGGPADGVVLFLESGVNQLPYHGTATTNVQGQFRFEKLPPGTYTLSGTVDFVPATRVTVAKNAKVERDIHMALEAVTGVLTACRDCSPGTDDFLAPDSLIKEFQQDREAALTQPVIGAEPAGGWEYFHPNFQDYVDPQDSHTGTVVIEGTIGTDGFVANMRIAAAVHAVLGKATLAALKDLPWTPARVRGVAVEVPLRLTVNWVRVTP